MPLVKFNLPTREQLDTVAKYWQYLLIGGFFILLISSNIYVYVDNQQTRKEVKMLNDEFRLYLYKDHAEMMRVVNQTSEVLDKAYNVGKENNELGKENNQLLKDLKNQFRR